MLREEADSRVEAAFKRHKKGDLEIAAGIYKEVLAVHRDHPTALHYLGLIAQQTGHSQQAVQLLQRSIATDPTDPRTYNHLGLVYVALNDKRTAATYFEQSLQIDPKSVDALNNLANVIKVRDLIQAIALYRRALELNPGAAFALYNLAKALNEDNACDEAVRLYERTIEVDPRHCQARHNLGVVLEQKGHFDEAIEQYLTVQRIDPNHVSSLANLIAIRSYEPDVQMVRQAEQMLNAPRASHEDRIKLHRGLGKHYDRAGEYDRAFNHFAGSKELMARRAPAFNINIVLRAVDRTIQTFSRATFAAGSARGRESPRPVFIVGMPRSGTTLAEQIIASHPLVFGAGELQEIPKIVKLLRPDYPECVATLDDTALGELADSYLKVIDALAGPDVLRVTDKLPINSMHLGTIAKLFPQARIIHCRRDPLDVAVSCFIELFELEHEYTTNFENFGRYFLQHERLMAHWRDVLPLPIHELRYEEMVADPEACSRALIAHCGLEWDPACLEFQKTERTVRTPSRWQVRQPIYRSSVGRWRNYAARMAPLVRLLEASGYQYPDNLPVNRVDHPIEAERSHQAGVSGSALISQYSVQSAAPEAVIFARAKRAAPTPLQQPIFIVAAPRSGSTLLFETLAASSQLCTTGGEAHWLVENHPELRPGAPGVESNRLIAEHATDVIGERIIDQILAHLVDSAGKRRIPANSDLIFLEKTPKNALRIPFFNRLFPQARFVFLWRDPRENLSSIMDAWRSGNFRTYNRLTDFDGPWSLLLPPGYQLMQGKPLEEIAAFQWECTNRTIAADLTQLRRDRWISVRYSDFVADPKASVRRIFDFANLEIDPRLAARASNPLPLARYTQSPPTADKWRTNEAAIIRVLPKVEKTWQLLQELV